MKDFLPFDVKPFKTLLVQMYDFANASSASDIYSSIDLPSCESMHDQPMDQSFQYTPGFTQLHILADRYLAHAFSRQVIYNVLVRLGRWFVVVEIGVGARTRKLLDQRSEQTRHVSSHQYSGQRSL